VDAGERAARAFVTLLLRLRHDVPRQEPPGRVPPFDRCYWVEPGRLLAGAYPGSAAEVDALRRTVTFVVDLTEEEEVGPFSEFLVGVERVRTPIQDFSAPTEQEMAQILDTVDHALARGEVVYVHCLGGRGRTGTVVGCHLVRHGLPPDGALARIAELRHGLPDGLAPSPETTEQVALVRGWRPGR
jgi:hypothetical protein